MEMPDLGTSSTPEKKTQFSNILILLLILLSSFLFSHPLYFLKLLSFLSPLLITTFLVLIFTSYRTAIEKLRGNKGGRQGQLELHCPEGSADGDEVYKIIFEAPQLDNGSKESEELVDKFLICGDNGGTECLQKKNLEEESDGESHNDKSARAEKTLEKLFLEKEESEPDASDLQVVDEKEVKEVKDAEAGSGNFDLGSKTEQCASLALRNSRRLSSSLKISGNSIGGLGEEKACLVLGGFGSMRRTEKEWKRTLACKLFEERHRNDESDNASVKTVGDEEGMDLLWETYEKNDSTTSIPGSDQSKRVAKEGKKLREELQKEDEEEEDNEEGMSRQFCCLQALKLSAGKVNLGMGRPNIARISKAFRGIGLLHHVRARKVPS